MRPRTIIILIAIFFLIIVAGNPIGTILVDIGNALVSTGQSLQKMKTSGG